MYKTLVADPPWQFKDKLNTYNRGAESNYSTLSLQQIKDFELPELDKDCRLFLWRVAAMQQEALDVMKAWGFTLKTEMVWIKIRPVSKRLWFGMGNTVRMAHETVLIGERGRPDKLTSDMPSVFRAEYTGHSRKPNGFYKRVERLSPGPYVELFARQHRDGWTCLGDEVGKFDGC